MEPVTVTIEGTRQATGLGVTKIYELINAGKLETIKIGRRTLVKVQSIRVLLDEAA